MSTRQIATLFDDQTLTAGVGASSQKNATMDTRYSKGGTILIEVSDFTDNSGSSSGKITFYFYASHDGDTWFPAKVNIPASSPPSWSTYADRIEYTAAHSSNEGGPVLYVDSWGGVKFRVKAYADQADATFTVVAASDPL